MPPDGSLFGDDGRCHGIVASRDPEQPVVARCVRECMEGDWWCEVHRRPTYTRHVEWSAILRSDWPGALDRARRKA